MIWKLDNIFIILFSEFFKEDLGNLKSKRYKTEQRTHHTEFYFENQQNISVERILFPAEAT